MTPPGTLLRINKEEIFYEKALQGFGPGGTTAAGHQQQQSDTEQAAVEDTSLHVAVNYTFESAGDITAFSMDLKNFDGIGGVSYRAYTNTGGFLWWYHDGGLTLSLIHI